MSRRLVSNPVILLLIERNMRGRKREREKKNRYRHREPRGVYWVSGEYCKITTRVITVHYKKATEATFPQLTEYPSVFLPGPSGKQKNGWVKRAKN